MTTETINLKYNFEDFKKWLAREEEKTYASGFLLNPRLPIIFDSLVEKKEKEVPKLLVRLWKKIEVWKKEVDAQEQKKKKKQYG